MVDLIGLIESVWPDLQISAEIGQGLGSRVYRAELRQGGAEKQSAVKAIFIPDEYESPDTLLAQKYSDDEIEEYLEARAQSSMQEIRYMQLLSDCGHIVRIEDHRLLHPEKLQYVVLLRMELLTPLIRRAADGVSSDEAAQIGIELCDALTYCHERKIVHRDIKPSNIFVDRDGVYKLGDFSVSKEFRYDERTLTMAGTPQFMAPELIRSSAYTGAFDKAVRTDIYSLGLVMYWLLNNRVLPFLPADRIASPEETSKAFERRISGEALPVPASGYCGELLQVIRKATDYNPDKRYADAAEMKAALLAACGKSPVVHKAKRKKRLLIIAALCALVIALAGVAYGFFLRPEPLPKNLNLPLHMDKDYINVVFLYPTQLTDDHSIALTLAQFDTAIEENWERWGVRDDTDIRNDLQRIINKDFYAMQAGVRVELVAYFPIEGEDYSEITKTYTSLGMPLFAFSSSDDDVIYSEWTELMEWVCR